MTTLRIVKTTLKKRNVARWEYAVCMTTLRIVKTTFMKRHIDGWEYAVCMTTLSIVKTTLIYVVYTKGIRRMYDDIAYSKDDNCTRCIYELE